MHQFADKVVVGLTGGITSGKSETLRIFQELGWEVISTDQIASDHLSKNQQVMDQVAGRWGSKIIFSRGIVDKKKIAEIIFNNPEERIWLESLLHPLVRDSWVKFIECSNAPNFVVELPLLFENNLASYFFKTICLHIPLNLQVSRLQNRGHSLTEAQARIDSQMPSSEKLAQANYIFLGSGSVFFLRSQVKNFTHNFLKK